jgi:RNA polymerase sigma-70 factor (sigma-E family)
VCGAGFAQVSSERCAPSYQLSRRERSVEARQPSASVGCSHERVDEEVEARADALRRAYEHHGARLLRLATLVAGSSDVGEEIMQETFVRAATAFPRLSDEEMGPYLRTVALNVWRNRLRRLALERRVRMPWTTTSMSERSLEDRDVLWRAIRRLPPRQRACLVLRYYEDLSERETATVLRCSVGTVKSLSSRGLARLRKELQGVDRG